MTELRGEIVVLREPADGDAPALRAIRRTPEVSRWWGPAEQEDPLGDEPGVTRLTILVDGEVAGLIQYAEESDPDYRHASIDLFVDPRRHRHGIGLDAIETLVRHVAHDRGHHRVTIDPALDNAAAIRCYERAGFRRVGVMQAAERDANTGTWRDALLMERLLGEPALEWRRGAVRRAPADSS